jgi:hypothetical protein
MGRDKERGYSVIQIPPQPGILPSNREKIEMTGINSVHARVIKKCRTAGRVPDRMTNLTKRPHLSRPSREPSQQPPISVGFDQF